MFILACGSVVLLSYSSEILVLVLMKFLAFSIALLGCNLRNGVHAGVKRSRRMLIGSGYSL